MMSADLTQFLLPSSRLPTDVIFVVSGKEVAAHKSFLATADPAFDELFFGAKAEAGVNRVKVNAEVGEETFTLFLRHMYGCKMEVAAMTELLTLAELHSLTCQFEQVGLGKEVKERLRDLVSSGTRKPCAIVDVCTLLTRHKVEELLPLVEEMVKEAQVGEEDLAGLLAMISEGGSQAQIAEGMVARYLGKQRPYTRQLAAFVRQHMLPADVLARILDGINDGGEAGEKEVDVTKREDFEKEVKEANTGKEVTKICNAGAGDMQQEKDVKLEIGDQYEKNIIKRFLEFTNFPEDLRAKMVEAFFE